MIIWWSSKGSSGTVNTPPAPSDVRLNVQYSVDGIDYVGELFVDNPNLRLNASGRVTGAGPSGRVYDNVAKSIYVSGRISKSNNVSANVGVIL